MTGAKTLKPSVRQVAKKNSALTKKAPAPRTRIVKTSYELAQTAVARVVKLTSDVAKAKEAAILATTKDYTTRKWKQEAWDKLIKDLYDRFTRTLRDKVSYTNTFIITEAEAQNVQEVERTLFSVMMQHGLREAMETLTIVGILYMPTFVPIETRQMDSFRVRFEVRWQTEYRANLYSQDAFDAIATFVRLCTAKPTNANGTANPLDEYNHLDEDQRTFWLNTIVNLIHLYLRGLVMELQDVTDMKFASPEMLAQYIALSLN
jgi:hypothetical protein